MDEMPSAQFRKVYAKLTAPTIVTVNGHPIGEWQPASFRPPMPPAIPPSIDKLSAPSERFNSRPFTPAPKHR
jgi:hypothetical protein